MSQGCVNAPDFAHSQVLAKPAIIESTRDPSYPNYTVATRAIATYVSRVELAAGAISLTAHPEVASADASGPRLTFNTFALTDTSVRFAAHSHESMDGRSCAHALYSWSPCGAQTQPQLPDTEGTFRAGLRISEGPATSMPPVALVGNMSAQLALQGSHIALSLKATL